MIHAAIIAAALAVSAFAAHAKTVVIDQTVDATILRNGENAVVYMGAPFTLSVGDTLTVNFSFLPGQSLQLVDPFVFGVHVGATDRSPYIDTAHKTSLSFQSLRGAAHNPASIEVTSNGLGATAMFFGGQFMNGGSGTISFSGAQFSTTIAGFSNGSSDREFSDLSLFALGSRVKAIAAVPEPANVLLFALGLVATLGMASCGRRKLHA